MCGINGIVQLTGEAVREEDISRMNKKIIHRGPDDQGVFLDGEIGLGHVRLSILDLSPRGHQPMLYEYQGRKAVITYNGEVYNFKEIRSELKQKGYEFVSETDTEVILTAYFEFGFDCLQKFNGMFSFVIYDVDKSLLFGARDRFGQKPLKYYLDDRQFIFSSELKAILENGVEREVDYEAVDDFLSLQYIPSPKTGFKNIYKLPHAHYFTLDIKTSEFKIKKYFTLDFTKKLDLSEKEWIKLLEEKLGEAVRKRLISDVPLGAFLSGGVDSSAIVALMSEYTSKIKTFSISFDERKFDESKYARQVANLFATDHTEFLVKANDCLNHIEDMIEHFEEPYADSSQLPVFILAKMVRKHVTVALSGDAGDENFGGYDKYRRHVLYQKFYHIIKASRLAKPVIDYMADHTKNIFLERLAIFFYTFNNDIGRRHYNYTSYFDEKIKEKICRYDFKEIVKYRENLFSNKIKNLLIDDIDKVYYLDLNTYLPDDINVKIDMASMKSALEVRSPMLDYEFVQLTSKIPWQLKTGIFQGKKIFKTMLEKRLPKNILYRKKHGFSVPISSWFRGPLCEFVHSVVLNPSGIVSQIIERKKLEGIVNIHMSGKDNGRKLWALLALNLWHKFYIQA